MLGLTLITWLRFVVWLTLGMIFFTSWGRYFSEFASEKFKDLIAAEKRIEGAMSGNIRQLYESQRKRSWLAWLLCFTLGIFGLHDYYLKRWGRGALCLAITLLATVIVTRVNPPNSSVAWGFVRYGVPWLMPLAELFFVVETAQQYNVGLARSLSAQ